MLMIDRTFGSHLVEAGVLHGPLLLVADLVLLLDVLGLDNVDTLDPGHQHQPAPPRHPHQPPVSPGQLSLVSQPHPPQSLEPELRHIVRIRRSLDCY